MRIPWNKVEQTSLLNKAGDIYYSNFKYSDEMTQRVKHLTPSVTSVKSESISAELNVFFMKFEKFGSLKAHSSLRRKAAV